MHQARKHQRKSKGAAIAEFGAAFLILVCFLFVPLVNLSFIGVRYLIAQAAIQDFAHRLALSEKRSDAYSMMSMQTFWSDLSENCGVKVNKRNLELLVSGTNNSSEQARIAQGQQVADEWLPGGSKAPCIYTMDLAVDVEIPPIFAGGPSIPGVTAAIPFKLNGRSAWENLSRDPESTDFYINK